MYYQQALAEDPQFAEALLNLGHALMAMGQEDEARSYWRKAIREKPELAQTVLRASYGLVFGPDGHGFTQIRLSVLSA